MIIVEFTSEEIICLNVLSEKQVSLEELANNLGLNIDSVRRATFILQEKGLINLEKQEASSYKLSKFGQMYLQEPFPEELILQVLKDKMTLNDFRIQLKEKSAFIFGYAMKNKLIEVVGNEVVKTANLKDFGFEELHKSLKEISEGKELFDKKRIEALVKMNLLEVGFKSEYFVSINALGAKYKNLEVKKSVTYLTQDMLKSQDFKLVNFKPYNVVADVEPLALGQYQPYMRFLTLVKQKLIALGFEEMPSHLLTTEFYNFDVLFQPQNHPARTWTATYSIANPKEGSLPEKDIVSKIKSAHEDGGNTGSKGWRYSWQEDVAKKLMPSAQGTAWSAKKMIEGSKSPQRYFAIARCYRPDVIDATHLSEFNQMEGFIVGDDISFRNLLGLLDQFAREVAGAEEVRFYPDYYPFTEPSVSLHAKHPKLGWVELGGAGIFRPEITETLGIKGRVIAWGLGIDRLAMFNLGITDIRELFSQKLEWLRKKSIIEKV